MKIVYGTTNASKLESMKRVTKLLDIEIIGLNEVGLPLPHIEEDGKDPLENAIIKAKAYYKALGMPVFSCDSGLYFEDMPEELQPGTHVRRVGGRELSDDEMIDYYSALAKKQGKPLVGRYLNAICLVLDEERVYTRMDESLVSERFILGTEAHKTRLPGYPLDSLSIDIDSGRYYYDLESLKIDKGVIIDGCASFFAEILSVEAEDGNKI